MTTQIERNVPPGAAYRPTLPVPRPTSQDFEILKKIFDEKTGFGLEHVEPPVIQNTVPDLADDAVVILPPYDGRYITWLRNVYKACKPILTDLGFVVNHYLDGIDSKHLALQPGAYLKLSEGISMMRLQFGYKYPKLSAKQALKKIVGAGELPLEPGVVLIALTMLAMRGGLKSSMRVECPGLMYSCKANGKFSDVVRWDVQPSTSTAFGLIALDWNWNVRERDLHGCASGVYIHEGEWKIY
jgi:hypothetical protein